jgi:hypothetical protein
MAIGKFAPYTAMKHVLMIDAIQIGIQASVGSKGAPTLVLRCEDTSAHVVQHKQAQVVLHTLKCLFLFM